MQKMEIKKYTSEYQQQLFDLLKTERKEWGYWLPENQPNFLEAIEESITFLVIENGQVVGFMRTLNDFVVWIGSSICLFIESIEEKNMANS